MTAIIIIAAAALLLFVLLASSLTVYLDYGESFRIKIKYLFFTILMNPDSPKRIQKREMKKAKKAAKEKKKAEKERIRQENKELKEEKKNSKTAVYDRADNSQTAKTDKPDKQSKPDKAYSSESPSSHVHYKKEGAKKDKEKKGKLDLELIIRLIKRASPHIKRLFKKIRFYDVEVDITVGGDDAAKVAVSYGVHCSIINGLAAFLDNTVTFKAKRIDIKADFDLEKSKYYAKGTVKLRLSTLLHSAIWGACAVLSEMAKANRESEKAKIQASKGSKTKKAA